MFMSFISNMFWNPTVLKTKVYQNGEEISLEKCSDAELESLADAIFHLWKTPTNSAVWFSVEIYERHFFFKRPTVTIEIECYKRDFGSIDGRYQVSVSKMWQEKMKGRRMIITPKDTLFREWRDMEVEFI